MPAVVAKGIIITISIVAALGIAVYENPEVQRWIDEQRRRIAELLRSIGEDLDPASRRAAEAFAFEGRTVNADALRREAEAKVNGNAAAVATGSSVSPRREGTVRRIPVQGSVSEAEMEERKRRGQEYLARREERMKALLEKRRSSATEQQDGAVTPTSPTSFDDMVDREGKLRMVDKTLPSPPKEEPMQKSTQEMREIDRSLSQPLLVGEASSSSTGSRGWQMGATLANPFSDDFELERSSSPHPPVVPPKIALEDTRQPANALPGSFPPPPPPPTEPIPRSEGLSYEEQLAIALSLSEAESSARPSATVRRQPEEEDDSDLRAAIEASLKEMDHQQAAHALANADPETPWMEERQPFLVDLTPETTTPAAVRDQQSESRDEWEAIFGHPAVWANEGRSTAPDPPISVPQPDDEEEDELYRLTPHLTRARLASFDTQIPSSPLQQLPPMPYDPVHEAASSQQAATPVAMDASFYSAQSDPTYGDETGDPPILYPFAPEDFPQQRTADGARTPTAASVVSSVTFRSSSPSASSDSLTFASLPGSRQAPSLAGSEFSQDVEVIDVVDDSEDDFLSDDGVATPDSWTEVGSRDGESSDGEREEETRRIRTGSS